MMVRANATASHSHTTDSLLYSLNRRTKTVYEARPDPCPLGHEACRTTTAPDPYSILLDVTTSQVSGVGTSSERVPRPNEVGHQHSHNAKEEGHSTWNPDIEDSLSCPAGHSNCQVYSVYHPTFFTSISLSSVSVNTVNLIGGRPNSKRHQHNSRWKNLDITVDDKRYEVWDTCPAGHANCVWTNPLVTCLDSVSEVMGTTTGGVM